MKRLLSALLVPLLTLPVGTLAQSGKKSATIEEVVVTARKRSESQQTVPLAVTAISSEEMAANNIATIADIAKITPGLDQREGRKQGAFAIRGVGQVRLNELQADPGVAVYMDGMFLARNDSQLIDTLAIQSVQVLRGPQGTLFGKNSVGGAILVNTKDPFEEFTLTLSSKLDSLSQRDAQIAMDIPLIDDVLYSKFTLGAVRSSGYAEDVDTGEGMGDDDRIMAALQMLWNIGDDVSLKTLAYFNKQEENIPPYHCQQVTLTGSISYARSPGRPLNYNQACSDAEKLIAKEKVQTENFGNAFSSRDALLGATLSWDLPGGTLKSITSYAMKGDNNTDFDIDATDLLLIRNTVYIRDQLKRQSVYDEDGSRNTLGQEFQFGGTALEDRLQYTIGVFGSWESLDKQIGGQTLTPEGWVGFERLPGLPSPNDACAAANVFGEECLYVRGINISNVSSYDNTSYAVFSQVIYDLTPALHLTGGLRYSYERRQTKLELFGSQSIPTTDSVTTIPGSGGFTNQFPITVMTETQFNQLEGVENELSRGPLQYGDIDFERLSPMASLSWDASEHYDWQSVDALMVYVTISEGFKSGGFNVLSTGIDTYDPEFVVSTELGFKLDALQRSLRLNMAVYQSDYQDIQIVGTKIPPLGAPEVSTNNAGLAEMLGAEFELTWLLSEALMLRASGNYIDADILEYNDEVLDPVSEAPIPIDRSNEPFPYIPRYVYSVSGRYALMTDIGDFDFVLSRNTRADQFIGGDAAAGLPQFRDAATISGVTTWSMRATWIPYDDQRLRVSLYGNNITDKAYVASGSATYSSFGTNAITLGKKRHFGLEVNYELR